MKGIDIKLSVLPVEDYTGDAGSKGKFLIESKDLHSGGICICTLPLEDEGDAGSKGSFIEN